MLFDDTRPPAVLVESRVLPHPPDAGPNRYVRGWYPVRREDGTVWLEATSTARLEFVELELRPRRLVLNGAVPTGGGDLRAELSDGTHRVSVPLTDRLVIEVPEAAKPGRRIVDLKIGETARYTVRDVAVEPTLPAGEVECDGSTCRQTGWSRIESVGRFPSGSRLRVDFEPPDRPADGQSFRVLVEAEDGEEHVLFAWSPGLLSRLRGRRRLDLDLGREPAERLSETVSPETEGRWLRISLEARGEGPPATWHKLRWTAPAGPSPRRPAQPVSPPPSPPRLVILYVLDAMRADHVTHMGGEAGLTPTLDRLAASGATFLQHTSAAPNTLPSTKTLFTGREFFLRGGWKLTADGPPTLAEAFRDAGYRTAIFSGNGNASANFGTDRGFEYAEESVLVGRGYSSRPYSDNAEQIHRTSLDWLASLGEGERAFLYLHTVHPHTPYDPPPELAREFTRGIDSEIDGGGRTLRDISLGRRVPTAEDRRRLQRLYAASVFYNDREIDRFLEQLHRMASPEDVFLVVTSDHGEELFDHGGVLHGYTLYEELLHIPLLLFWPGMISPVEILAPSGTLDVHDGLRALVDADASRHRLGFWRQLAGAEDPGPEPAVRFASSSSVPGGIFAAWTDRWKVIWAPRTGAGWGMGGGGGRTRDPEYVFDRKADPEETVNLAGSADLELAWLRARLRGWIDGGVRAEVGGEEAELDEVARDRLRALGYLD